MSMNQRTRAAFRKRAERKKESTRTNPQFVVRRWLALQKPRQSPLKGGEKR